MPWYRVGGTMMHINMGRGKRAKKAAPACPFFRWDRRDGERIKVRCMCIAPFLCDWPGCDVPICGDHALELGENLHVCPHHNHQRGLLSRLLPAPKESTP